MATKKKSKKVSSKRTSNKKSADVSAPAKKERTKREKAPAQKMDRATMITFMQTLISAGYLGEDIPEVSRDQHKAAQRIRQMAEKFARQLRKYPS